MRQLLLISWAAECMLSDVAVDGIVEAADTAVIGMRNALQGKRLPKFIPANA